MIDYIALLDVVLDHLSLLDAVLDQNAGSSHIIKTDNSSFKRVEDFQCSGTT